MLVLFCIKSINLKLIIFIVYLFCLFFIIQANPPTNTYTTRSTNTIPSVWSGPNAVPQPVVFPDWAISKEEYSKSYRVFCALDQDADGLVSGLEVRDVLSQSNLPQTVLAKIWNIVDFQNRGVLNR